VSPNPEIKVWMLTGDKMETAENIAKSCNLIQPHFEILRYTCAEPERILSTLQTLSSRALELNQQGKAKGFLIEGADLTPIIGNEERERELSNLARYCDAVVCCRLLPIQKA
jgi:phospholipid-transporting ATPase